jgi:Mg-chelatase subunit ChlD
MREDYTHITLVVDRSGSMDTVRKDAEGGINSLLKEQFALDGKLTVTLVDFDTDISTVKRLAGEKFTYRLVPRGGTALLDAVGGEIVKTGEDLALMKAKDRPAKVLFVVVTDGEENSSREYTIEKIKEMTDTQKAKYSWDFQFIGADQAAWAGTSLGMNTTQYVNTGIGNTTLYTTLSNSTSMYRAAPVGASFAMASTVGETVEES